MDYNQYTELVKYNLARPYSVCDGEIQIDDLKNKTPHTLLLGMTYYGHFHHLYIDHNGNFCISVYNLNDNTGALQSISTMHYDTVIYTNARKTCGSLVRRM